VKIQEIASSLQTIMSKRKIYLYSAVIVLTFFVWLLSASKTAETSFSEHVKVAIREAGHRLLLTNQDSTSLVLPIIELENSVYELSFGNELTFLPDDLVKTVKHSFKKGKLPEYYRVSVIQCKDNEVAYSYEMSAEEENTLIPCASRSLPANCYTIEIRFTKRNSSFFQKETILYILIFIVFIFLADIFINRKKRIILSEQVKDDAIKIGSFLFYPGQNKLLKDIEEINLSKKECELLTIFVANKNRIIKRQELTKKVWEDNGVVVGRSLDTYISKLRKILKDDDAIKLINVHGVGYKLEVN